VGGEKKRRKGKVPFRWEGLQEGKMTGTFSHKNQRKRGGKETGGVKMEKKKWNLSLLWEKSKP